MEQAQQPHRKVLTPAPSVAMHPIDNELVGLSKLMAVIVLGHLLVPTL
jgi:hypothetical protein